MKTAQDVWAEVHPDLCCPFGFGGCSEHVGPNVFKLRITGANYTGRYAFYVNREYVGMINKITGSRFQRQKLYEQTTTYEEVIEWPEDVCSHYPPKPPETSWQMTYSQRRPLTTY